MLPDRDYLINIAVILLLLKLFVFFCQYYLKTGTCKFGATCKFHHPRDKAGTEGRVSLNVLGYPLRPVWMFNFSSLKTRPHFLRSLVAFRQNCINPWHMLYTASHLFLSNFILFVVCCAL